MPHRIPLLGGSTAILRDVTITSADEAAVLPGPGEVPESLSRNPRRSRSGRSLRRGHEDSRRDDGRPKDAYDNGTQFEWMAYRRKTDKRIVCSGLLLGRPLELRRLAVHLVVDGRTREFVIPATCLNLALFKAPRRESPSCKLTAAVDCSPGSAPPIVLTATAAAGDGAKITEVTLTREAPPDSDRHSLTKEPYTWSFGAPAEGAYSYAYSAVARTAMGSPRHLALPWFPYAGSLSPPASRRPPAS